MFGHQWEPAGGTIVESRTEQTTIDGETGLHAVRVYVIDVRKAGGQTLRATVQASAAVGAELTPGTAVRLEVHSKTAEVRFDPRHSVAQVTSGRDAAHLAREPRGEVGGQAPDTAGHGAGGPVQSVGFSSPEAPSTFDPVTPATPASPATAASPATPASPATAASPATPASPATFSSPAAAFGAPGSAGPPGGSASPPASFSSPPVAPAAFEPGTPGSTFGSFGGSSFDSFGRQSKADRIARLEDQRERGQLTRQQFETQRQQIVDES